jgi:hypothetical protein
MSLPRYRDTSLEFAVLHHASGIMQKPFEGIPRTVFGGVASEFGTDCTSFVIMFIRFGYPMDRSYKPLQSSGDRDDRDDRS